ncbi:MULTISPECIES: hypothetical protein [Fictibacillus]|uniref:hypothetical protein n=1 Tax=Fictibacillus TaxID=1329200 RepID=UPI001028E718|nr:MULTISPECIES: hypothetical protein [Fictibacillus]RZT23996.1 hypothetical protein EV282_3096 [Fictibacillus sp. BK138]
MRLNVQYIPLRKIKPNLTVKITEHIKKLRNIMWDCMHILVVKKEKDGTYTIISGNDRYEYLQKHTKNKCAPCIIDENKLSTELKYLFCRIFNVNKQEKENKDFFNKLSPKSISIIRNFLKEEPRFKSLSRVEKTKILILAIRYKKTVITAMKLKVDECLEKTTQ